VRVLERLRREDEVVVLVRAMEGVADVGVADSGIGVEVPVVGCEGIGVLFWEDELEDDDERSERVIARRKRSLTPIFVGVQRFFSSGSPVLRFSGFERFCLWLRYSSYERVLCEE